MEEWKEYVKQHPKYKTILKVSNTGRVIIPEKWIQTQWDTPRYRPEREAKYSPTKTGYIRAGGGFVHRIVAELFVEKPKGWNEKWDVNHKDLDKSNNHSDNLEWVTHRENLKHYLNSEQAIGEKLHPVEVHTVDGEWVGVFPSKDAAAKHCGMTKTMVGYITQGRFKQSKGYVFKEITKEEYNGKTQKD